jgi:hypothetical protein
VNKPARSPIEKRTPRAGGPPCQRRYDQGELSIRLADPGQAARRRNDVPEASVWMTGDPRPPVELHTDRPHAARIYDYLLGGKTYYAADQQAAQMVCDVMPTLVDSAREGRAMMHRVVRYLAGEAGVRQFLDIGTGIPTSPNLHEVAQSIIPEARVVYTDNDPIVLVHSRALHESGPQGATAYVQADARDPGAILAHPEIGATLDWSEPVALTMLLLLHWLPEEVDPEDVVRELLDALPSGSYLAISYATADFDPAAWEQINQRLSALGPSKVRTRTKAEVARFFDGLDLVPPGIVVPHRWRPDPAAIDIGDPAAVADTDIPIWAAVARKP